MTDDAKAEVSRLKALAKRRRWPRSPLDRYAPELRKLRAAGASYEMLSRWLSEQRPRAKADRTVVRRYMLRTADADDQGAAADADLQH